jgi:hypothetical protein
MYITELALLYKQYNIIKLIIHTYNSELNLGLILEKTCEYKFNILAKFLLLNYNIEQIYINNTMILAYYSNNFEIFKYTISYKNFNINNDYILKHSSVNKKFKYLLHILPFYNSNPDIVKHLYYYKFVCFLWKIKKNFTM